MSFADLSFSCDDLAAAENAVANPYLSDPAKGLGLITRLVVHPSPGMHLAQHKTLKHLGQLIHENYVNLAAKDSFPAEALAYRDLQALEDSLQDLVTFPDLANKTVVGIGGSFSAGKSRFLNTLLGVALLPEALEPTTAIPTFLTGGQRASIVALNAFDHSVEIDAAALDAISHRFHEHYKKTLGEEVGFAHILKLLMLHRPDFPWQNLAFLDTPGYSKAEAAEQTYTDANVALRQLAEADVLVWLVNAKNGSIRQDDISFLRSLGHAQPLFVVVTQADLVGSSRIEAILQAVRDSFSQAGIAIVGLMAWAAPLSQLAGSRVAGDDFMAWLNALNLKPKRTAKRRTCTRIFGGHILHNSTALQANKVQLATLNELLPLAQGLPESRRQTLNGLIKDLRQDQSRLSALVGEFDRLKEQMLAAITDIVGSVAIDEDVHHGREALLQLPKATFKRPLKVGQRLNAAVISIETDLKCVKLAVGDESTPVDVRFSAIREGLRIDPQSLFNGNLLLCEARALDDKHVTLAFFQH
jgi:GTP-binding protein EngB required for normal cell division